MPKIALLLLAMVLSAVLLALPVPAWLLPLPALAALAYALYFPTPQAQVAEQATPPASVDVLPAGQELEALLKRQTRAAHEEVERVQGILNEAIVSLTSNFTLIANAARQQQDIALQTLGGDAGRGADHLINETGETLQAIGGLMLENHATAQRLTEEMMGMGLRVNDMMGELGGLDDIAKKIHFLSLNANIEAARAGEAGRGFVVVAEEVHKLAQYTRDFSERIRKSMGEVRNSISSMEHAAGELSNRQGAETEKVRHHVDETLVDLRKLNEGQSQALNALSSMAQQTEQGIASATTALQFQDMVNQLLAHARRRIDALQAAMESTRLCQQQLQSGEAEALTRLRSALSAQEAALAHNPVAQRSIGQGDIELF